MKVVKRVLAVLWLTGCSALAPLPDAGSPGVDGGGPGRDAGPEDAGVEVGFDAGPAEPTFSSAILYRDDFESHAGLTSLRATYPILAERRGALDLDTSVAAAGTKSLRIDYAADGGCDDAEVFVGKLVSGDVPEVVASWRFRLSSGFLFLQPASHCGGAGAGSTEWLLTRPGDAAGRITLEVSAEPEHPALGAPSSVGWRLGVDDAFAQAPRRAVYAQHLRVATHGPLSLPQDAWHRATLAVTRESTVGGADGVLRLWIDGAIVIDRQRVSTGTAPIASLRYPTTLRAGASRPQTRWVDEVVLFTP